MLARSLARRVEDIELVSTHPAACSTVAVRRARIFSHTEEATELSSFFEIVGDRGDEKSSGFPGNYRRRLAGLLATALGGGFSDVTYPPEISAG